MEATNYLTQVEGLLRSLSADKIVLHSWRDLNPLHDSKSEKLTIVNRYELFAPHFVSNE